MNIRLNTAMHIISLAIILFLLGYIVSKKLENLGSGSAEKAFLALEASIPIVQEGNQQTLFDIRDGVFQYPSDESAKYSNHANTVAAAADSIVRCLDSIKLNHGKTILREKMDALLRENDTLHFLGKKVIGYDTNCWDVERPGFYCTQLSNFVGDTLTANFFVSKFINKFYKPFIRLNGKPLSFEEGMAPFQVKYDKPGVYPLVFSSEHVVFRADSVQKFEKTFYLRVRP